MNRIPEIWHDRVGQDFPGVDVKASVSGPYLKWGGEQKIKAPFYFGTVVNLELHLVQPLGYATLQMLQTAPMHVYKHGSVHRLGVSDLLSADYLLARVLQRNYPLQP